MRGSFGISETKQEYKYISQKFGSRRYVVKVEAVTLRQLICSRVRGGVAHPVKNSVAEFATFVTEGLSHIFQKRSRSFPIFVCQQHCRVLKIFVQMLKACLSLFSCIKCGLMAPFRNN